jgi:hypothetical protein
MVIKMLIIPAQYMFFLFQDKKELDMEEYVSYILLVKL